MYSRLYNRIVQILAVSFEVLLAKKNFLYDLVYPVASKIIKASVTKSVCDDLTTKFLNTWC